MVGFRSYTPWFPFSFSPPLCLSHSFLDGLLKKTLRWRMNFGVLLFPACAAAAGGDRLQRWIGTTNSQLQPSTCFPPHSPNCQGEFHRERGSRPPHSSMEQTKRGQPKRKPSQLLPESADESLQDQPNFSDKSSPELIALNCTLQNMLSSAELNTEYQYTTYSLAEELQYYCLNLQ